MSLFGLPVQRDWADIYTMEEFLVSAWPTLIVELGTGTGAFSVYFAGYAAIHGARFVTFDNHKAQHEHQAPNNGALSAISALGGIWYEGDVFDRQTVEFIESLIVKNEGPAFIYCDNGDKPREVEIYSRILRQGDYLGVHDYGTEIKQLPEDGFILWRQELFFDSTNRILEKL